MNENKKLSRKVDKVIKDMAGSVNILSGPAKVSQQLQKIKKDYGAVAEIQEKIVNNLLKTQTCITQHQLIAAVFFIGFFPCRRAYLSFSYRS